MTEEINFEEKFDWFQALRYMEEGFCVRAESWNTDEFVCKENGFYYNELDEKMSLSDFKTMDYQWEFFMEDEGCQSVETQGKMEEDGTLEDGEHQSNLNEQLNTIEKDQGLGTEIPSTEESEKNGEESVGQTMKNIEIISEKNNEETSEIIKNNTELEEKNGEITTEKKLEQVVENGTVETEKVNLQKSKNEEGKEIQLSESTTLQKAIKTETLETVNSIDECNKLLMKSMQDVPDDMWKAHCSIGQRN